ncbi:MAG: TetR/AcrR family transcriptional regulator [Peptoniphilaceae bacterium]
METAYRVFSEKGYAKTTINEIAEECNTSRTPIYYHFENKEGLYLAIIEKMIEKYINIFDKYLYTSEALEVRLFNIFDILTKDKDNSKEISHWLFDVLHESPEAAKICTNTFFEKISEKITTTIEVSRISENKATRVESKEITELFLLALEGAILENKYKLNKKGSFDFSSLRQFHI